MLFAAWIWLCFNVVFCLGCVLGDRCWFKRGHTKSISFGRRVLWNLVNQCWFIDCSSVVHLFWVGEGHKSLWPDIKVSLWPHASVPSSTAERWLRRTGMTGSVKAFEVGPISELECCLPYPGSTLIPYPGSTWIACKTLVWGWEHPKMWTDWKGLYIPRTWMTSILDHQPPKIWFFPIKTEVK